MDAGSFTAKARLSSIARIGLLSTALLVCVWQVVVASVQRLREASDPTHPDQLLIASLATTFMATALAQAPFVGFSVLFASRGVSEVLAAALDDQDASFSRPFAGLVVALCLALLIQRPNQRVDTFARNIDNAHQFRTPTIPDHPAAPRFSTIL